MYIVEVFETDDESFVDILIRIPQQSRYTFNNLGILCLLRAVCSVIK